MNKYILPICSAVIILTQVYNYYMGFRVELMMIGVALLLIPPAKKIIDENK